MRTMRSRLYIDSDIALQVEAQLPDMRARARAKLSEVQEALEQLPPEPYGSPMQQLRTLLGRVAEGMQVGVRNSGRASELMVVREV